MTVDGTFEERLEEPEAVDAASELPSFIGIDILVLDKVMTSRLDWPSRTCAFSAGWARGTRGQASAATVFA